MYYGGRGYGLENMIEVSNKQYSFQGEALIQKIPTPVKVLDINQRTGKIKSAFYEKKSTVDYIGIFNGVSIAFDAKETKVETRFDLSNVKEHQYYFLDNWDRNGGISFLIIHFITLNETYYLPFSKLRSSWESSLKGGRKSIKYKNIAEERYRINGRGLILLDYLDIVKRIKLGEDKT
ncbi:Holliday junction resolvase RecU [Halonatronum saccharophilum]|uniref:Holliday junction resolvase RecU n=1 Tax=Halonatronum saccharophilum TaxID=150060 RepID=UPI000480890A|nr:Holliday junction resolvase RecU [Halonatronum saccharophilum]